MSLVENEPGGGLHAMDYMVYADLQLARDKDAGSVLQGRAALPASILITAAPPMRWPRFRRVSYSSAACGRTPYSLIAAQQVSAYGGNDLFCSCPRGRSQW